MADDERLGMLGAGQRTSERVGGAGERGEAIRHTANLVVRRLAEVAFWALWVPLVAGPWCLTWYVPIAFHYATQTVGGWLGILPEHTRSEELTYRASLVCIGAAVALGLLVLPDWALIWWPWRWQIPAATWRGLLWPARWLAAVPSCVLIRAVLIVGPWRAARETRYLDWRQRQEIVMPTLSGVAFSTPDAFRTVIPGVPSFHRDPQAPTAPPSEVRAIFRLEPGNGNGHGTTRIVDCPDSVATLEQLRDLANLVLNYSIKPTRQQIVTKRHLFTDTAWRTFQAWALQERLVAKGATPNAAYELTSDGHTWLRTLQEGEHDEPF